MLFKVSRVDYEYSTPFRISYKVQTHAETVHVKLLDGEHVGVGEGLGVFYHGETADALRNQIDEYLHKVNSRITRELIAREMPPGGARNAVDCALWDLEAKRCGRRVWDLANTGSVRPLRTAHTIGLDEPDVMALSAVTAHASSLLKLKLTGEGDLERVDAVRTARPDADLIVDANQAWNKEQLKELVPQLAVLGVKLIEQPLAVGEDDWLAGYDSPIPLCADESCQTIDSLDHLEGKYTFINIKLDKTGGLTAALELAQVARERGFELMVGCMAGSSLSMAPGFVVGQLCRIVDLDGPLLSKTDVANPIRYEEGKIYPPDKELWG